MLNPNKLISMDQLEINKIYKNSLYENMITNFVMKIYDNVGHEHEIFSSKYPILMRNFRILAEHVNQSVLKYDNLKTFLEKVGPQHRDYKHKYSTEIYGRILYVFQNSNFTVRVYTEHIQCDFDITLEKRKNKIRSEDLEAYRVNSLREQIIDKKMIRITQDMKYEANEKLRIARDAIKITQNDMNDQRRDNDTN